MTSTNENPTTRGARCRRFGLRRRSERGAALVEFAFVAVPLFMILFGTIEFGWAFFQLNDIRHGAREGIRIVAVDSDVVPAYIPGASDPPMDTNGKRLAQATCERMDQKDGVLISIVLTDLDSPANGFDIGDGVTITASKPLDQLTMIFDPVLSSVTLEEVVTSRMEQSPSTGIHGTKWWCQ